MNKILKHPAILIILLTIVPTLILMLILSDSPFFSIYSFFTGPFTNSYSFYSMIRRATPLILTSLGAFLALKSDSINLGGEGQVYLGATLSGILLISFKGHDSYYLLFAVIIVTLLASGLITFTSAILHEKYGVSSLISTYLLSMSIIHICNYIITNPFLLDGSNILTTEKIASVYQFSSGIVPSLLVTLIISFLYKHSLWGYEFRISGRNRAFSESMGIKSKKYRILGLTFSGMLHGAAGILLVVSSHYSVTYGMHSGLGWNGLSSALIAGNNPLMVILSSLLYAYLDSGASYATVASDVTIELSTIIKSILFFVISSRVIKNRLIKGGYSD